MTDRDRIADIIDSFFGVDSAYFGVDKYEFADHLLANGVIVPPCNVGDTVYYITGIHNTLVKGAKVEEIYVGEAGFAFHLCCDYTYFTLQQEDVFLTKEEAEKALKEREG